MNLESSPTTRWCVVNKRKQFSLATIKQEILRHDDVQGDFTLSATPAPARDQTLFKVYSDGTDLLVAVGIFESVAPSLRHSTYMMDPLANRNHLEIFFAPWNDELGWVQFCFQPDGTIQTFNHLPYPDAASTSFAVPALKRFVAETDLKSQSHRLYWLFAWFPAKQFVRNGAVCGFNIARFCPPIEEWSAWNHTASVGFQDATSFGKLALRKPSRKDLPRAIALRKPTPKQVRDFRFAMTYDIPDNISYTNHVTPARLDNELARWKSWGIQRINWIEYGPISQFPGLWSPDFWGVSGTRRRQMLENIARSQRHCDDTLKWATKSARRHGLEIFAVYKPFDLGFNGSLTRNDRGYGVKEIENRYACAHPDVVAHQELTMRANPAWLRRPVFPITRLCVYSEKPGQPFPASRLTVWTSNDNEHFTKYRGRLRVRTGSVQRPHTRWTPAGKVAESARAKNWRIELSGLEIRAPFIAIEIAGKTFPLAHRMFAFVEAWGADGSLAPVELSSSGSREKGFSYNKYWPGWANHTEPVLDTYTWTGPEVALRFGDAENITTLFEPTYAGARQIWLQHVQRILDTGVDGVDIRTIGHHNGTESYLKFAFAEPVREEFRRRFGREVEATETDYQRVRQIRGAAYTTFLRDAKALAKRGGQKLGAHIEWGTEVPQHLNTRLQMQIALEWERWIRDGIVDEVSLRGWGCFNPHVQKKLLPLARRHGVRVNIISTNLAGGIHLRAMELCERLVTEACAAGYSGYSLYESDSFLRTNREGQPMTVGLVDHAVRRARRALDALRKSEDDESVSRRRKR